jgi:hypothetical protein
LGGDDGKNGDLSTPPEPAEREITLLWLLSIAAHQTAGLYPNAYSTMALEFTTPRLIAALNQFRLAFSAE